MNLKAWIECVPCRIHKLWMSLFDLEEVPAMMLKSEYIHIDIIVTSKNICNIFDCIHISDTLSASGL